VTKYTRRQLAAWASDYDVELYFLDPAATFDGAIRGVIYGYGQEPAVLYDDAAVIGALAVEMGEDDAEEFFNYNTLGAYVGQATPRFLMSLPLVEGDPRVAKKGSRRRRPAVLRDRRPRARAAGTRPRAARRPKTAADARRQQQASKPKPATKDRPARRRR